EALRAPVECDAAVAARREKKHPVLPRIRAQRPSVLRIVHRMIVARLTSGKMWVCLAIFFVTSLAIGGTYPKYENQSNDDRRRTERHGTCRTHSGRRPRRLQSHCGALPDIDLLPGLQPDWQSRPKRGCRAGNFYHGVETSPAFA